VSLAVKELPPTNKATTIKKIIINSPVGSIAFSVVDKSKIVVKLAIK